mmetsp:Transcript_8556/g.25750  ORF Transcript_8556/g.25750 Transcript_8556/m.25750 type:complete len:381 (+) Transcript_8556:132-1274(+)|eukprot:CAMPEP_0119268798 /NCGR_PEP_ID=MMETSP1329-20130426/6452_1 /TAXON_ID=114041 /ORGANISM="Genus nov. species nov., Strain RCC1024" /LENGTH=380 /DNA_ID=CAMNT_0007268781 /DNA_START=206 /DNA_END=1348 /DNA_ORIENTATION=+
MAEIVQAMGTLQLNPDKKWSGDGAKLEDSNMAMVGSDVDKAARKGAAEKEPAWSGAGAGPGTEIWRVENFKIVPWPKEEYGNFFSGDSYIILKTSKDPSSGKLLWDIHFWLGESTSQDEAGVAAYKTVELDDLLDQAPIQHREVQGHESLQFTKLFKQINYMAGGVESGFNHVEQGTYAAKLFRVRKTKHTVKVAEVPCARASLNQGDCFLLDTGDALYPWFGESASAFEKAKAGTSAHNICQTRHGKCAVRTEPDAAFWAALGGEGPIAPETDVVPESEEPGEGVLFRLSDASGSLTCTEVGRGDVKKAMLDTNDVFLLDAGREIFVWIGTGASDAERRNAMSTAIAYLGSANKPIHTAIHCFKESDPIKNDVWDAIMD